MLFSHCPRENAAGVFCLDSRAQDGVLALGIYFLESGCQHDQQIVPYLIKLVRSLPKVVWIDDVVIKNNSGKIPAAERFTFCINTLLSDIAVHLPDYKNEIIQSQVETLGIVANLVKTSKESSMQPIILCKAIVPILLGLGRSISRFAGIEEKPLLCRIFPRVENYNTSNDNTYVQILKNSLRQSNLNQFRSIVPRSLSGSLSVDSADVVSPKMMTKLSYYTNSVPYDPKTYFFTKVGSSFNQFSCMRLPTETNFKKPKIQFPINHLQSIFAIAKKLLTKELLEYLDEQACDIFNLHQIKLFGYKSFSETINLVIVTLLKELLDNQSGKFMKTKLQKIKES